MAKSSSDNTMSYVLIGGVAVGGYLLYSNGTLASWFPSLFGAPAAATPALVATTPVTTTPVATAPVAVAPPAAPVATPVLSMTPQGPPPSNPNPFLPMRWLPPMRGGQPYPGGQWNGGPAPLVPSAANGPTVSSSSAEAGVGRYMRTDGGMGSIVWGSRTGVGEYDELATPWTWLYYPPPYDFADPNPTIPPPTFIAPAEEMGMGGVGCGCGGTCGGCGGHAHGMGQLFASGFDISGWGIGEWSIVALGAYALISVVFTTKSAASSVSSGMSKRRRSAAKRAALKAQLAGL